MISSIWRKLSSSSDAWGQAPCYAARYRRHAWSLSRPPFQAIYCFYSPPILDGSTRKEADRDRRRDAADIPVGARNRTHEDSLHCFSLGRVSKKAGNPGWRWHLAVASQSVVDDQPRYGFVGCNLSRQNQGSPAVQRGCDMWGETPGHNPWICIAINALPRWLTNGISKFPSRNRRDEMEAHMTSG
jgi:hypothetical protein